MPVTKTNDASLYCEVQGRGKPLLLIAGLGSDSSSWAAVTGGLSLYFQVIVFDNRGSGRSDSARKPLTICDMAGDAVALLDFFKIEQAHILGHSMGGYIAQELAIGHPERVDRLILESTAPVSSARNNLLFQDIHHQLTCEGYCPAWFKQWIPWLFSGTLSNDSVFVDTFVRTSLEYPYLQKADGFKGQIDAIARFDARDRIGAIRAKTLVLEGKDDVLITPPEARMLADGIPESAFQLLDGAAHAIHIENPALFTDAVLRFLKNS